VDDRGRGVHGAGGVDEFEPPLQGEFVQVERFTVVTAVKDASACAVETAASIVGQRAVRSGRVSLQYLVFDAGKDGTGARLRKEFGDAVEVRAEPDRGLYDALAKGLRMADGDVVSYLNAGDVYHPSAFDVVADVMEAHPVRWLTGMQVICNRSLHVVEAEVPFRYRRDLLLKGLYGQRLPFLQQESTFWARSLHPLVDFDRLATCRLAGDYYLWRCFAREEEPAVVAAYLGGFTVHPEALSADQSEYFREVATLADPPGLLDGLRARCERWRWRNLTNRGRKRQNPSLFAWDEADSRWR
jgi:glycosyltransferase involved in cell wall biosynthesis